MLPKIYPLGCHYCRSFEWQLLSRVLMDQHCATNLPRRVQQSLPMIKTSMLQATNVWFIIPPPPLILTKSIQISHKFTLTCHTNTVNALAISPQGNLLLSGDSCLPDVRGIWISCPSQVWQSHSHLEPLVKRNVAGNMYPICRFHQLPCMDQACQLGRVFLCLWHVRWQYSSLPAHKWESCFLFSFYYPSTCGSCRILEMGSTSPPTGQHTVGNSKVLVWKIGPDQNMYYLLFFSLSPQHYPCRIFCFAPQQGKEATICRSVNTLHG